MPAGSEHESLEPLQFYTKERTASMVQNMRHRTVNQWRLFQLRRHFTGEVAFFALDTFSEFKALNSGDLNRRAQIFCGLLDNC